MDVLQSSALSELLDETEQLTEEAQGDYLTHLLCLAKQLLNEASSIPSDLEFSLFNSIPSNAQASLEAKEKMCDLITHCLVEDLPLFLKKKGSTTHQTHTTATRHQEKEQTTSTEVSNDFLLDYLDTLLLKAERVLRVAKESGPTTRLHKTIPAAVSHSSDEPVPHNKHNSPETSTLDHHERDFLMGLLNPKDSCHTKKIDKARWQKCFHTDITHDHKPFGFVKEKFHAKYPLPSTQGQHTTTLITSQKTTTQPPSTQHLYDKEIHDLDWDTPTTPEGSLLMYQPVVPQPPQDLDSTPLVWVKSPQHLHTMIEEIKSFRYLALDVEHHSQHSFHGCTCLIQLSTREKDYLIDPLDLRPHLWTLNQVTAHPGILKVLHGALNDVVWLQRDFSIYFVNLFDTSVAAHVLAIPGGASLANLLLYYCQVSTKKKYQLADWRKRPLTKGMIRYARTDSHYLLYIHDRLRNDLLKPSEGTSQICQWKMNKVLQQSRLISLKQYTSSPCQTKHTLETLLLKKFNFPLDPPSRGLLMKLLEWRETIAKSLDEGPHFILSNPVMCRVVVHKPRSWADFQRIVYPMAPILYHFAQHLLHIIHEAAPLTTQEPPPVTLGDPSGDTPLVTWFHKNRKDQGTVSPQGTCEQEEEEWREVVEIPPVQEDCMSFQHDPEENSNGSPSLAIMSGVRYVKCMDSCPSTRLMAGGLEKLYGWVVLSYHHKSQKGRVLAKAVGRSMVMKLPCFPRSSQQAKGITQEEQYPETILLEPPNRYTLQQHQPKIPPSQKAKTSSQKTKENLEVLAELSNVKNNGKRQRTSKNLVTATMEPDRKILHGTGSNTRDSFHESQCSQKIQSCVSKNVARHVPEKSGNQVFTPRKHSVSSSPSAHSFLPVSSLDLNDSSIPSLSTTTSFYGNVASQGHKTKGLGVNKKKRRKFGR